MEDQAKKPEPTNTVLKVHKVNQSTGVNKPGSQKPV